MTRITGGCQCGAVRYACQGLGRAVVCHCRMCQKALGNVLGVFVMAQGLTWTRGKPKYFASSNKAMRGFCAACGTPLCVMDAPGHYELAVGTLDHPQAVQPEAQVCVGGRASWLAELAGLPTPAGDAKAEWDGHFASVISKQHPDHDTEVWPPADRTP
ncbi:MAG: GFA family protein [Proteobacteria bacterium]|nr:GFA family protein [Pseudomonadota bacterium]